MTKRFVRIKENAISENTTAIDTFAASSWQADTTKVDRWF
jgi:hypothetical protein